ncbi:MAG: GTPase [Pseudomonadota bacterium]
MKLARVWRWVASIGLLLALLVALRLIVSTTDGVLDVWTRLQSAPAIIRYAALAALVIVVVIFAVLCWRLLRPRRTQQATAAAVVFDEAALRAEVADMGQSGADVSAVETELQHLEGHRDADALEIALFGEVSTGKTSLAKALLPDAEVVISPLAGSTTEVARYAWQASTGATITLSDLPGLDAVGKTLDAAMMDEARRAHAVVFVTDGDLTRQQLEALTTLAALRKPLIVTLNKADRYSRDEQATLLTRLQERISAASDGADPVLIVTVAGGEQSVVVEDASGTQSPGTRARQPDVSQLVLALEELLGGDLAVVNALREQSLLSLANEKLLAAKNDYRQQRAAHIVRDTTRKAVVGALAAVTPGTDIVIQGYLGSSMTKRLCALYGQQARELDIESFLNLSQSRVGTALPVTLAIAGNGLKAFPGAGTIAGGLVHAVAYGLIFDAVGRGLIASLEAHGAFAAEQAANAVRDSFEDNLNDSVKRIARLALDIKRSADD